MFIYFLLTVSPSEKHLYLYLQIQKKNVFDVLAVLYFGFLEFEQCTTNMYDHKKSKRLAERWTEPVGSVKQAQDQARYCKKPGRATGRKLTPNVQGDVLYHRISTRCYLAGRYKLGRSCSNSNLLRPRVAEPSKQMYVFLYRKFNLLDRVNIRSTKKILNLNLSAV